MLHNHFNAGLQGSQLTIHTRTTIVVRMRSNKVVDSLSVRSFPQSTPVAMTGLPWLTKRLQFTDLLW